MIFNSMANLWSGSNGINILPPGGGNSKSPIKSIQHGICTLSNTSLTVNINEINLSCSILLFTHKGKEPSSYRKYTSGELNTNNIVFKVNNLGTVDISWTVIEFDKDLIRTIQRGKTTGLGTVSINKIDLSKSFCIASYTVANSSNYVCQLITVLSDTYIQLSGDSYIKSIIWQVIEFI